jgi:hypothetical protein
MSVYPDRTALEVSRRRPQLHTFTLRPGTLEKCFGLFVTIHLGLIQRADLRKL